MLIAVFITEMVILHKCLYFALTNRAGGLYGRILTEVVSTDRTKSGLYARPRTIKIDALLANGDEQTRFQIKNYR